MTWAQDSGRRTQPPPTPACRVFGDGAVPAERLSASRALNELAWGAANLPQPGCNSSPRRFSGFFDFWVP